MKVNYFTAKHRVQKQFLRVPRYSDPLSIWTGFFQFSRLKYQVWWTGFFFPVWNQLDIFSSSNWFCFQSSYGIYFLKLQMEGNISLHSFKSAKQKNLFFFYQKFYGTLQSVSLNWILWPLNRLLKFKNRKTLAEHYIMQVLTVMYSVPGDVLFTFYFF